MSEEETVPEEEVEVDSSIHEIAREVIAGRWGRGLTRKRRLQEAGYDVSEISAEITKIFNQ